MNARVLRSGVLLLALLWGSAQATSISWKQGTVPPAQWTITPANPGPSDVIQFSGPTKVHSNSCMAEAALGGTPQLAINPWTKVITLSFQGPPPQWCPLIYMPVCGLEGEFGPLEPGEWRFTSPSKDLGLDMTFTVGGAAVTTVYRVDAGAPGPVHDGSSWARAFRTLQDALAVAGGGDEIWVARGVYKPDRGAGVTLGDRAASFVLAEGLTIRGGFAGYGYADPDRRYLNPSETVLSGDLMGNDQWGFINLEDNSYHVITGPLGSPPAVLDGLTVVSGYAVGSYLNHHGGGLYNPGGEIDIVNCTFEGNWAIWGGGIANLGGTLRMVNTRLIGNRAMMLGGGLYNYSGHSTLHNARIVGNSADYAEVTGGAAIYNVEGALEIRNSTITDNRSPTGRAIASFHWQLLNPKEIRIVNSILYNGGDEIWTNSPSSVQVTHSLVQGGWAGTGNIDANPQFVAPGSYDFPYDASWIDGDYRLMATSPAVDAGRNAALPADILDLDGDGDVTEPLPLDLDNTARVKGTRVDMGAYERATTTPPLPPPVDPGLIICIGGNCIPLEPDPDAPPSSYAYIGSTFLSIELNFRGQLSVTVTPQSPAGGDWTGWVVPDIVGPGSATIEIWVRGENLNLAALPAGAKDVQVAEVKLFVVPVP